MSAAFVKLAVATVVLSFVVGCTPVVNTGSGERSVAPVMAGSTLYRSLELGSPEAGARALIDAWSDRDFVLVHQLLDASVQETILEAERQEAALPFLIDDGSPRPAISDEHLFPGWRAAERYVVASQTGGLQADLVGASVVDGAAVAELEDRTVRDVDVVLRDGRTAVFRMAPSVTGRWRLIQMGLPDLQGADPTAVVVTDACSVDPRVELRDGVSCEVLDTEVAVLGMSEEAFEAEAERLMARAGDDIGRQVEAEQAITNLALSRKSVTARALCLRMQGHRSFGGVLPEDLSTLATQAAELNEDTCPGDVELVRSGPVEWPAISADDVDNSAVEIVSYVSLDFATPTSAVTTFSALIEAQDHYVLSSAIALRAQSIISGDLFWGEPAGLSRDSWQTASRAGLEHGVGVPGFFDDLMLRAAEADDYLVDVRNLTSVGEGIPLQVFDDPAPPNQRVVLVEATSDRYPQGLGFVVVQAPSGRWRVRQVAAPASAIDSTMSLFVVGD